MIANLGDTDAGLALLDRQPFPQGRPALLVRADGWVFDGHQGGRSLSAPRADGDAELVDEPHRCAAHADDVGERAGIMGSRDSRAVPPHTGRAFDAWRELRPGLVSKREFVHQVDQRQRLAGYRLIGSVPLRASRGTHRRC